MKPAATTAVPTILFGAFDRHNFGDLLFPHIAATLLQGRNLLFAGLVERDLRPYGGHQVRALARLAEEYADRPVNLIHAGGELLTCNAWQAAVMLLPAEEARDIVARFDERPEAGFDWARSQLGLAARAPYTVSHTLFPKAASVIYNAVGGVDLDGQEPELRAEVLANLRSADEVSVRDKQTLAQLDAAGIPARLVPDPAVMVAELFGAQIRPRQQTGELAGILAAFPQGYLAVQFSADFGDDATLATIAAQLDRIAALTGYAVVLFRAGAAPWHDDLDGYRRLASRMHPASARLFLSLNLWDICALIAHSRAFCGSSLHGRIVAAAFAVPHVSLIHPSLAGRMTKQAAYAATWESPGQPAPVSPDCIARGIHQALSADPLRLQQAARDMALRYREGFGALCAKLE